jgi:hypothetical protein
MVVPHSGVLVSAATAGAIGGAVLHQLDVGVITASVDRHARVLGNDADVAQNQVSYFIRTV